MATSRVTIKTKTIADELVRLIKASVYGTSCLVVQVAGIEQVAGPRPLKELLPAVFVVPTASDPKDEPALDVHGTQQTIVERFRIACFSSLAATDSPFTVGQAAAAAVVASLSDEGLSSIASAITPAQVLSSRWRGTEWQPEEAAFLIDNEQMAKVVVVRWEVEWYAR